MPRQNNIQIRRGTNSEWASANTTLVSGEPAFETDTLRLKIGDGLIAWSGLNYIGSKETLSLVRNDTGDLISAGQALYASGVYNNSIPSVAKYVADGSISENLFIGLANSNISNNSHGYATSFGQIDNLNTVGNALNALSIFGEPAWANGTLLYAHPTAAGKLTSIPPTRAILIGTVIYAHGTQGKIFVRSKSYGLLDNLYDVNTSSASNNQYLQYNSASSSWIPTSSGIFNNINVNNNTINITSSGSSQPNLILFNDSSTPNPYSVGSISNGMRLLLSSNNSLGHNAIGVDYAGNNNTWFSVPSGMSFKFFDGNDTIFSISRTAINYNGSGLVYGAGGTTNYLSKFTGGSILANSLIFDNGTNVGIGTAIPSDKLNVIGNISAGTLSTTQGKFIAYGSSSQPNLLFEGFDATGKARISTNSGANRQLKIENDGASNTLGVYIEGDVGIGTDTPTYKLQVNGSFAASTKSFRIHHPSKKDHSLEYGSLESPYHGVRLTGRDRVIKGVGTVSLPDYLKDLIHDDDTLNIQITNIKHGKTIYIDKIDLQNDCFMVKVDKAKSLADLEFFWTLTGVRKDVDHLVVEKRN
jgi:hypothetical protein